MSTPIIIMNAPTIFLAVTSSFNITIESIYTSTDTIAEIIGNIYVRLNLGITKIYSKKLTIYSNKPIRATILIFNDKFESFMEN